MNPQTTLAERRHAHGPAVDPEQAALRRVAAHVNAEAAELPPDTWLAPRLEIEIHQWGERVLPDLARLMSGERGSDPMVSWVRVRSDRCPLTRTEESCLRRIASVLRAEADELGPASSVGVHLSRLGIMIWLECEPPAGTQHRRVLP